jgi:O-antigen ligase
MNVKSNVHAMNSVNNLKLLVNLLSSDFEKASLPRCQALWSMNPHLLVSCISNCQPDKTGLGREALVRHNSRPQDLTGMEYSAHKSTARGEHMRSNFGSWSLAGLTAAVVTTATFAKTFLPFYLIGSTQIFTITSTFGIVLVAVNWRQLYDSASKVTDVIIVLGLLYGVTIISYLSSSYPVVPVTYLLGILIFHALFLIFGFAAARALRVVLLMLMGGAAVYLVVIARYTLLFGDLMRGGYLHDLFGVGVSAIFITFHLNIGNLLGLAALAALGLGSTRIRKILATGALLLVLIFMFHIAARTALVALLVSLIFLAGAALWVRSRKWALLSALAVLVAGALASGIFYQRALENIAVDALAPDAISRTIREIQDPRPLFRIQIWQRAWQRILSEPDRLLLGRGIGIYPVDEGFGAPDWLLRPTEGSKYYPHNVHLEMLYETGIVGLLLLGILSLFPLVSAIRRWPMLSLMERSAIAIYVFNLLSAELSGSFAFSYDFQFFFALAVGVIAANRLRGTTAQPLLPSLRPAEEVQASPAPLKEDSHHSLATPIVDR